MKVSISPEMDVQFQQFIWINLHIPRNITMQGRQSTPENKSYIVKYIAQLPGNVLMEL